MSLSIESIIDYESGNLSDEETLELFACLIRTGDCWRLQGHYGRVAAHLIDAGYISRDGKILRGIEGE